MWFFVFTKQQITFICWLCFAYEQQLAAFQRRTRVRGRRSEGASFSRASKSKWLGRSQAAQELRLNTLITVGTVISKMLSVLFLLSK